LHGISRPCGAGLRAAPAGCASGSHRRALGACDRGGGAKMPFILPIRGADTVAHLHFRRTVHKSGGKQASARVRYITRETEREPTSVAARQLRYVAREGREDLLYTRSRNLPGWAQGRPQTYFRAAEQYEWARGNAFEEWKITLPQELSPRQNMALMRDLVATIAGERLPITYAFHCPPTMDGTQAQPHLHLLISGRQEDGIVRTPAQHFKK